MVSIGLTGNIASGKSHIAEIFASLGVAVQDSDKIAHLVLQNEAFDDVKKLFPEAVISGGIDRKKLGAIVFADDAKLKKLEAIIHPLVRQKNLEFIRSHKLALVEIPLLFETEAEKIFDHVIYIDVSEQTQKQRALARGLSAEKLAHVLGRQHRISPEQKRAGADFVIDNNPGADTLGQIKQILAEISK